MKNKLKYFKILNGRDWQNTLAGFYPNGNGMASNILRFSNRQSIIFNNENEAREYIEYMRRESLNSKNNHWIDGLYDAVLSRINKMRICAEYDVEN